MRKNIMVLSFDGTVIGQTYPRRAKGLVRKGRAHYVDEYTLRLIACPPDSIYTEEKGMNHFTDIANEQQSEENTITAENCPSDVSGAALAVKNAVRSRVDKAAEEFKNRIESSIRELEGLNVESDAIEEAKERLNEILHEDLVDLYEVADEVYDVIFDTYNDLEDDIDSIQDEINDIQEDLSDEIEEATQNDEN